jgi:hypothetical protein
MVASQCTGLQLIWQFSEMNHSDRLHHSQSCAPDLSCKIWTYLTISGMILE